MIKNLSILHEDDILLIVDKPAGLLTMPDRYNDDISVLDWARREHPAVAVAHRIDRDTSGVLCLVKDKANLGAIASQWEARTVRKDYIAIVEGKPAPEGTIHNKLLESSSQKGKMVIHKKGKEAITHYKVREQIGNYAILDVTIDTGRMHQIRVHLEHIGCPLVVDRLYGPRPSFYLSSIKRKYRTSGVERPLLSRHSLHAARLTLQHPGTGLTITAEAALPKDMKAMINQLDKWIKR